MIDYVKILEGQKVVHQNLPLLNLLEVQSHLRQKNKKPLEFHLLPLLLIGNLPKMMVLLQKREFFLQNLKSFSLTPVKLSKIKVDN